MINRDKEKNMNRKLPMYSYRLFWMIVIRTVMFTTDAVQRVDRPFDDQIEPDKVWLQTDLREHTNIKALCSPSDCLTICGLDHLVKSSVYNFNPTLNLDLRNQLVSRSFRVHKFVYWLSNPKVAWALFQKITYFGVLLVKKRKRWAE